MPLSEKQAIVRLWRTGHMANPLYPDTHNLGGPSMTDYADAKPPKDLAKLTLDHPIVKQAIASYQDFMSYHGDMFSLKHHDRPMQHDGDVGPATKELLAIERCAVPDYTLDPLPAVGTGNWPRCHNVGNFHAATFYVNRKTMPAFLVPIWDRVIANVKKAYAEVGLKLIETDDGNSHNTSMTWVRPDGGWIGLAIVGRNLKCSDKIWQRYDQNYKGGSSTEAIVNQQSSLKQHEWGHNVGLGHSRGGVMNSSIINGLPQGTWKNDPSESQLKKWYGGEPVPGGNPLPPDVPVPPTGGGDDIPRVSLSVTVPPGFKPGTYNLVGTRFEGV